jgi:uncharacterized protein (DUF952 family)
MKNRQPEAFCYLGKYGDEENKASIIKEYLWVEINGQKHIHSLGFINSLALQNQKMLYYLALGGVISSLCLVSIVTGFYEPWTVNLLLVLGLFLFYYGYRGKHFLIIVEPNNITRYFIKDYSPNLDAFISYVNKMVKTGKATLTIYHLTTPSQWETYKNKEYYDHPSRSTQGFIHASLSDDLEETANLHFPGETDLLLLTIEATRLTSELKMETARENKIFPHIYGVINKDAIIAVKPYR